MTGSVAVGILLAFTAVTAAIHFFRPTNVGRPIAPRPTPKVAKPLIPAAEKSATPGVAPSTSIANAEPAQPATPEVPPEPVAESIAPSPTRTPPGDPLGIVTDAPPAPTAPTATADPLARFDRILAGGADDPLQKSTAKPAVAASLPPPDAAPARPIAPRPPPREIDVAR
ncbi:MAG TPA: hypothetical protein VL860_02240, partial [Planctomycetota bacterium]|nr:hypothetical protein [Planctomycetota bacterium]